MEGLPAERSSGVYDDAAEFTESRTVGVRYMVGKELHDRYDRLLASTYEPRAWSKRWGAACSIPAR